MKITEMIIVIVTIVSPLISFAYFAEAAIIKGTYAMPPLGQIYLCTASLIGLAISWLSPSAITLPLCGWFLKTRLF